MVKVDAGIVKPECRTMGAPKQEDILHLEIVMPQDRYEWEIIYRVLSNQEWIGTMDNTHYKLYDEKGVPVGVTDLLDARRLEETATDIDGNRRIARVITAQRDGAGESGLIRPFRVHDEEKKVEVGVMIPMTRTVHEAIIMMGREPRETAIASDEGNIEHTATIASVIMDKRKRRLTMTKVRRRKNEGGTPSDKTQRRPEGEDDQSSG